MKSYPGTADLNARIFLLQRTPFGDSRRLAILAPGYTADSETTDPWRVDAGEAGRMVEVHSAPAEAVVVYVWQAVCRRAAERVDWFTSDGRPRTGLDNSR